MYEKLIPSIKSKVWTVSFADQAKILQQIDISDLQVVRNYFEGLFKVQKCNCILGPFGEERFAMLESFGCQHMLDEQRVVHLGLDLITMAYSQVTTPLTGRVVLSQNEAGPGQFGGTVVLESEHQGKNIHLLFGHLDPELLPPLGAEIQKGATVGKLGSKEVNGGWLEHLHFQVLTQDGFEAGFANFGYGKSQDIGKYVLDPKLILTNS